MQRVVVHVDMDAFYASCEELRHPELSGRPVIVGADPANGRRRGVVMAANRQLYNPLTREFVPATQGAPAGGAPFGAPDYLFIRPGALFLGDNGALCTYMFIYRSGTKIGTAGHGVDGASTVFILPTPAPTIPLVTALGTVASSQNVGIGNDWALIDINPV